MTSNIRQLDPVQGLVDYILDIKPYHTKVIEILTEYVYNEQVETTISENFHLEIGLFFGGTPLLALDKQTITLGGFGAPTPFGGFTSWPVIPPSVTLAGGPFVDAPLGYDIVADTVMIPGDRTNQYMIGSDIEIDLYAFDTALETRTVGDQTQYTILDVEYVSFGQINAAAITPHTLITVAALNDPATTLPALGVNEVYVAGVNLVPVIISSVIDTYSNAAPVFYTDVPPGADPLPTPTVGSLPQNPDENPLALVFSNSFVVDGDVESAFPQGFFFEVVDTGTTSGLYTTKYAYYDIGVDKTYVRVIEHIETGGFIAGTMQESFFGYDESFIDQTQIPEGCAATNFVEYLVFSWDSAEGDIIDGWQLFIKDATSGANTFQVNGDATGNISNGQVILVQGSTSNDGTYTVSAPPTFDGQYTDITVAEAIPVTEMGGWVECTLITPALGPDVPGGGGSPLTAWSVIQNIEDPALTGDGMFGQTVAISDDGLYVFGGPGDSTESVDTGGVQFDGAVISYQESGGTYITPDLFSHTDAQNFPDYFGGDPLNFTDSKQIAVFENGSRIAVGAYYYPQGGTQSGAVYIFDLAGTYSQTLRLDLGGVGNDEQFGFSITTSGDGTAGSIMVIGAPGAISGEGRVYVYENQVGVWTLIQTLAGGFGANDQQFGTNVTMSRDGSTLAVGENWESGAAPLTPFWEFFYNTYSWNGSTFDLIERFTPNPAGDIWNGGYMQAELSDDGTILSMSIGDNYVWVATLSGGTWSTTNLTALMPGLNRYTGLGMNGLGDLIFVGSNSETGGNGASGVVHVLKNSAGWVLQDTIDNPDVTDVGYSEWGRSIESNIAGDILVVGNGYADGGFGGGGAIAIVTGV